MTAAECLALAKAAGPHFQRPINGFVDAFRRADMTERERMIAEPISEQGKLEGLVSGIVSALCREVGLTAPDWVAEIGSPEPFFAYPAQSFEMRVRLMIESPAPFLVRNVFVPENYMERA